MEFEIDQARFLSALSLAQTVADKRATMPVLANVLLRASSDGHVVCSATDMMISLTETTECRTRQLLVAEPGPHERENEQCVASGRCERRQRREVHLRSIRAGAARFSAGLRSIPPRAFDPCSRA